ncbi:zinc metallopeptidase [Coralliovum pocilloporae]|uniref:zinc metallopeptidase n=1 Tax=Coralliovum pocilloporae TaxID=3066369 RepID=UPI003306A87D
MIYVLLALVGLAVIFGPRYWVQWVIKRHSDERRDFPGTGGELARHLLDEAGLSHVRVERVPEGDHYDPDARAVRLSAPNYDGQSVTAVAIAAHEVSHALQDANGYTPLALRTRMARNVARIQRLGSIILFAAPILFMVIKAPVLIGAQVVAGLMLLGSSIVFHLLTLPVELDASFNKALPILSEGGYLSEEDLPAARHVLRAAAFTYVAAALTTLLNAAYWLRILR